MPPPSKLTNAQAQPGKQDVPPPSKLKNTQAKPGEQDVPPPSKLTHTQAELEEYPSNLTNAWGPASGGRPASFLLTHEYTGPARRTICASSQ